MKNFHDIGVPPELIRVLDRLNIVNPTEVQELSIPVALRGDDILASAQTGTGKTAASPAQSAAGSDRNAREKGSTPPLQAISRVERCPRSVAPAWFCPRLWGPLSLCKRVRIGLAERYRTKCASPANQQLLRSSSRELTEYVNRLRSAL